MHANTHQPATASSSLAYMAAHRFGHYVRTQFNPNAATSWATADALYRSALLAIRGERKEQP